MLLQCETGSILSRGIDLKSCIPRKSQAAQAPSKVWAITCACLQLGGSFHLWGQDLISGILSAASGNFPSFSSGCALFPILRSLNPLIPPSGVLTTFGSGQWNAKNQSVPATMTSCPSVMPSLSSGLPQLLQQPSHGILTAAKPCPLPGFLHPHLSLGTLSMNTKILYCHFVIYLFWSV